MGEHLLEITALHILLEGHALASLHFSLADLHEPLKPRHRLARGQIARVQIAQPLELTRVEVAAAQHVGLLPVERLQPFGGLTSPFQRAVIDAPARRLGAQAVDLRPVQRRLTVVFCDLRADMLARFAVQARIPPVRFAVEALRAHRLIERIGRVLRAPGGLLRVALHRVQPAGQLAQRPFALARLAPDPLDLRRHFGLRARGKRQRRPRLTRVRIAQRLLRERAEPLPRRRQRATLLGQGLAFLRKRRFGALDERLALVEPLLRRARILEGRVQLAQSRVQPDRLPPRFELRRRESAPLRLDLQRLSGLPRLRVDLLKPRSLLGVVARQPLVDVADARRLGLERLEQLR